MTFEDYWAISTKFLCGPTSRLDAPLAQTCLGLRQLQSVFFLLVPSSPRRSDIRVEEQEQKPTHNLHNSLYLSLPCDATREFHFRSQQKTLT